VKPADMPPPLWSFGDQPPPPALPVQAVLLGATGSIGRQTIELAERHPDRLVITGLSAHRRLDALAAARDRLRAAGGPEPAVAVSDAKAHAAAAAAGTFPRLLPAGEAGLRELAAAVAADVVVNALVGVAGLPPTWHAVRAGRTVALANKESLVAGGEVVRTAAAAAGARVIPVDSEHSALAQCLVGRRPDEVAALVLTASGGPFRDLPAAELAHVTLDQVLDHPTWNMGPKITVDSATLMNKGLEVIEAHHLFGADYDAIEVLVHPDSLVHALVRFRDGALLAHLGAPDMRVPLAYALWGERHLPLATPPLDLAAAGALRFARPDTERFPCLRLAREAGRAGGSAPVVLNAANEVAVAGLLAGRLRFVHIARVVAETLAAVPPRPVPDLDAILAVDAEARRAAAGIADRIAAD